MPLVSPRSGGLGCGPTPKREYGSLSRQLKARRGACFAVGPGTAVHPVADERVAGSRSSSHGRSLLRAARIHGDEPKQAARAGAPGLMGTCNPRPMPSGIMRRIPRVLPKLASARGASAKAARRRRRRRSAARCRASTWRGRVLADPVRGGLRLLSVLALRGVVLSRESSLLFGLRSSGGNHSDGALFGHPSFASARRGFATGIFAKAWRRTH